MSNTVWDAISKDLLAKVEVEARGLDLTKRSMDHHWTGKFQDHNNRIVEEFEYALMDAESALGAEALGNLLKREDWLHREAALTWRRATIYRELERLDALLTIITDRRKGEVHDMGGGPTAYAWNVDRDGEPPKTTENPSITLTDDQVSTVKEHT